MRKKTKKDQKNKYDKKLSLFKTEHKDEFESWIDSEITWFLVDNSTCLLLSPRCSTMCSKS